MRCFFRLPLFRTQIGSLKPIPKDKTMLKHSFLALAVLTLLAACAGDGGSKNPAMKAQGSWKEIGKINDGNIDVSYDTGSLKRPLSRCPNLRASCVSACSLPSICVGKPTIRFSGCHCKHLFLFRQPETGVGRFYLYKLIG